ncbi:HAD-IIB family hydrolase [Pasteurella oralis]|uniref:HAD-IIB family hydrolase n=1 Tax=Pasteurella oralis TaxID=1071947 RepID=UPI000C7E8515|nr:HAD-IIB family hydrolase [Pasteurella oralis]
MIFVFDLDGTICFDGKHIPSEIEIALEQLMITNHQLIFASARPIRDLLPLLNTQLKQALLIGGNGSITQVNQQIQANNPITHNDFNQIKQWIQEYDLDYLADDLWHYSKRIRQPHSIEHKIDSAKLAENRPLFTIQHPIKTILLNLSTTHYFSLKQNLSQLDLNVIEHTEQNGSFNLDITASHINKYNTLTRLIGYEKYIAFGNDINDFELLQHATYAVCIGNFAPLQSVADITLPANPALIADKIIQLIANDG